MKTETATSTPKGEAMLSLTMADGTVHYRPVRNTLKLMTKAQRVLSGQVWPLPDEIWQKLPEMILFRDAISITASDNSRIHELLVCMIVGPDMRNMAFSDDEGLAVDPKHLLDERSDG